MKIVYIAHPISGDIPGNIQKVKEIVKDINLKEPDIYPYAPYIVDCETLDDNIPEQRAKGIKNNQKLFEKGIIDELWLYGDKITKGMIAEIKLAETWNIPVFVKTELLWDRSKWAVNDPNELDYLWKGWRKSK